MTQMDTEVGCVSWLATWERARCEGLRDVKPQMSQIPQMA
jgi:hypothetical protein